MPILKNLNGMVQMPQISAGLLVTISCPQKPQKASFILRSKMAKSFTNGMSRDSTFTHVVKN